MTATPPPLDAGLLDAVSHGAHHDPHAVLGIHALGAEGRGWVVRTRRPLADSVVAVFDDGTRVPLNHRHAGIWEGVLTARPTGYVITATYPDGSEYTADDPYRHGPTIGELDLHLVGEGRHEELWNALGAHLRTHDGVAGASFAVWAPNAQAVRVVGDFCLRGGVRSGTGRGPVAVRPSMRRAPCPATTSRTKSWAIVSTSTGSTAVVS